ncbi:MAG: orotidine 5'-phosphate decarboxylase [Planctomycetes bacterium]|nr:orotidine 5'-phosphate decarboxylase [Planctomycetota bacterium]
MQLQLAIDVLSTQAALALVEKVYPYYDIAEIGTPLIIEEGMHALAALKKKFPDRDYLADLKIMDAGAIEATSGYAGGADIVTVLAAADDVTISKAVEAAQEYNAILMADLINIAEPVQRAKELEALGVDIVCVHTAYDVQSAENNPLDELQNVRAAVSCRVAVAGGLKRNNIQAVIDAGADIVIVGGAIATHADPAAEAQAIYEILDAANKVSSK